MEQSDQQDSQTQTAIRGKLTQIFRYLQALHQWRNPPQRQLDASTLLLWFHDLPVHPCIVRGVLSSAENEVGDDFILQVTRPRLTDVPLPPREILPWLQDGWQSIDGHALIRSSLTDAHGCVSSFADDPRREALFAEWKSKREQWVTTERPARQTMALYEKLYGVYAELEREGERFELILGDGRLHWQTASGVLIDYPLLHRRLQLQFRPEVPAFLLIETEPLSELYTASFQGVSESNATAIGRCRAELAQENWHPLGGEETSSFFRRLVRLLHSQGQFHEQAFTEQEHIPQIIRDPVIFRHARNIGISTAIERILEDLPERQQLPYALTSLISDNTGVTNERQVSSDSSSPASPNGEDAAILLSKPANAEQLEIARRLDKYGAVLVQGPPGTGKTHTIANLIGYLLAQGKRVLVTSEKPKALRVLREKVVEPLQPLCVSMLDDDSRQQMTSTIDAISERLARENADRLEREAATLTRQREEILHQLGETRQELLEAQGAEYRPITIAGTSYSPSAAARHIARTREKDDWLPGPLTSGAVMPLTRSEILTLYSTNETITPEEERDMNLLLPEPGNIPPPVDLAQSIREQAQLHNEHLHYREDLWFSRNVNYPPEVLHDLQRQLAQEIEPIKDLTGWNMAAITAGRDGGIRQQIWEDLLHEIQNAYQLAERTQWYVLKYAPALPADCLSDRIVKVLEEIIAYLQGGGKLGMMKLLSKRDWKTVLEKATVKGQAPESIEDFQALLSLVQLNLCRKDLFARWQRQMIPLGGSEISQLGQEPERAIFQFVDPLRRRLEWFNRTWAPLEQALKQQGFHWEALLAETPIVPGEYSEMLRLRAAVVEKLPGVIVAEVQRRRSRFIENRFLTLERELERIGGNTNPAEVVQHLYHAVKKRDAAAYEQAYHRLVNLHAKRVSASQREALLRKLEGQAPAWANAIRERIGRHGKSEVPGNPEDAWLWRQLNDELERRAKVSLVELQDRVARLNSHLFQITAELVEKRAWEKQIRHTTVEQRRALQGWRELMKKVGKGTGKRAPRLLAEAQQLIPICQSAVPVWIMPLNYVARNFDMKRNHFDVIILDEASQADITALFAAYMGDQIVIVGDDEQVSPMAVGQHIDAVNQLIDEHLRGIPLANMYDGKLSIYSLARTTFEPVCLLEHFRCVSPIIKFSNDLSYQGKIKPLRDDSEVKRRPFTVAYAVNSSGKEERINKAEAEVTASLLIAATQQPEYQDATFGVISMVAGGQATYIDRLIQKYLSAPEYMQRRILCGDPSQFQGDERDVIFLSLVDVAENGPLALRNEDANEYMWKKRFNVAASRARDQLWVVHSLDPEIDLKPGDIRRKLILHARDQHLRQAALATQEQRTESEFEKRVLQRLVQAGYRVTTQWPVGAYRIDMVVEGNSKRLAVECDGDRWHPVEKLAEDMARQTILERLGWRFVRIRGSQFFRDPDLAMQPVFERLQTLEIAPIGMLTEKQSNSDGKEIKDRIIRQADALRTQWRTSENAPVLTPDIGIATRQYTVLKQNAVTAAKESVDPNRIKAATQRNALSPSGVRSASPVTPSNNLGDRAFVKSAPPQPAANGSIGNARQGQFNPILHLQTRGYKVIDRRDQGGGIWVVGGNELAPMMKWLAEKGYAFKQIPGGLGPAGDGWYLRSF